MGCVLREDTSTYHYPVLTIVVQNFDEVPGGVRLAFSFNRKLPDETVEWETAEDYDAMMGAEGIDPDIYLFACAIFACNNAIKAVMLEESTAFVRFGCAYPYDDVTGDILEFLMEYFPSSGKPEVIREDIDPRKAIRASA